MFITGLGKLKAPGAFLAREKILWRPNDDHVEAIITYYRLKASGFRSFFISLVD